MRWVLASNNPGKLQELQQGIRTVHSDWILSNQSEFGVPEVAETGPSFVENALIKARHAAAHTGLSSLADDSGIVVEALGGAPGIHSAYYAGMEGNDTENVQALLEATRTLRDADRSACFICVLVLLRAVDDPMPMIAEGIWHGTLLDEARGKNGFGYDPVFFLPQQGCTAAELSLQEKNRLSHRAQALRSLLQTLRERP